MPRSNRHDYIISFLFFVQMIDYIYIQIKIVEIYPQDFTEEEKYIYILDFKNNIMNLSNAIYIYFYLFFIYFTDLIGTIKYRKEYKKWLHIEFLYKLMFQNI